MATIEEQRAADERSRAIAQLKAQRAEIAGKLEEKDKAISALETADFMAKFGTADVRKLSDREKSRIISKLGAEKYLELIGIR
jgi:hypothetical protein